MPSFKAAVVAALAAAAYGLPTSSPSFSAAPRRANKRQSNETSSGSSSSTAALNDFDILQFALTLENLEETFYRQGFAKFPESDFAKLGLNNQQLSDLKSIGKTEEEHVNILTSALAQAGITPVQPCTYDFKFTDAKGMVATAAVLENVGVSAYLGAAPLIKDKSILGTAGSILTIEARHQSSIRLLAGQQAIPQAFDAPLGPRAVFSLAAPFIKECPRGSNLNIQAFPALSMSKGQDASSLAVGSMVRVQAVASGGEASASAAGATNCAFTSGGVLPGGTTFSTFSQQNGCQVPQGVAGVTYLTLTTSAPIDGALVDDIVVAGPMVLSL